MPPMKSRSLSLHIWLATSAALPVLTLAARGDTLQLGDPKLKVRDKAPPAAAAFALRQVRLLDGPFRHAQELDA